MVNICFSSVSQHACIYFSLVYPGAAIYQMHINSPFAALSFLISYSTSMIVSYYPCFTGGLFIESRATDIVIFGISLSEACRTSYQMSEQFITESLSSRGE